VRYAVNPLQLYAGTDGLLDFAAGPPPNIAEGAAERAGFRAIQANLDIADPAAYRKRLASCGLAPAPGYFHAVFDQPVFDAEDVGARFRNALTASRALGLSDIVVACAVTPAGRAQAGRAQDRPLDDLAVDRVADRVSDLGRSATATGVRLCFHQHVGTAIESPAELEALLAWTDPDAVQLCQDTGHLVWGGVNDLAGFLTSHFGRTAMLHIKDLDRAVLGEARAARLDYGATVRAGLWREPGWGDLDLSAVLEPWRDVPLWAVVEVDRPSLPDAAASLAASHDFTLNREAT